MKIPLLITAGLVLFVLLEKARGGLLDNHVIYFEADAGPPVPVPAELHYLNHYHGKKHKALLVWHSETNRAYMIETANSTIQDWHIYTNILSGTHMQMRRVVPAKSDQDVWRVSLAPSFPAGQMMNLSFGVSPYLGGAIEYGDDPTLCATWIWSGDHTGSAVMCGGGGMWYWRGIYA